MGGGGGVDHQERKDLCIRKVSDDRREIVNLFFITGRPGKKKDMGKTPCAA